MFKFRSFINYIEHLYIIKLFQINYREYNFFKFLYNKIINQIKCCYARN